MIDRDVSPIGNVCKEEPFEVCHPLQGIFNPNSFAAPPSYSRQIKKTQRFLISRMTHITNPNSPLSLSACQIFESRNDSLLLRSCFTHVGPSPQIHVLSHQYRFVEDGKFAWKAIGAFPSSAQSNLAADRSQTRR